MSGEQEGGLAGQQAWPLQVLGPEPSPGSHPRVTPGSQAGRGGGQSRTSMAEAGEVLSPENAGERHLLIWAQQGPGPPS